MKKFKVALGGVLAILVCGGLALGGFAVGSATTMAHVEGSMDGYNLTGQNPCNFFADAKDGLSAVDPHSKKVTSYGRAEMYAADVTCTNDQIQAFNTFARKAPFRTRVCRFDFYPVPGMIWEDEPMSCKSVALQG